MLQTSSPEGYGSLENVIAIQKEKLEKIKALLKGDTRADQSHT